jgi:hypothetical protein
LVVRCGVALISSPTGGGASEIRIAGQRIAGYASKIEKIGDLSGALILSQASRN